MSDRDFGRYNCTARNNIGVRYQEFILAQAGESAELPTTVCPSPELMRWMTSFSSQECVQFNLLNHRSHSNSNVVTLYHSTNGNSLICNSQEDKFHYNSQPLFTSLISNSASWFTILHYFVKYPLIYGVIHNSAGQLFLVQMELLRLRRKLVSKKLT